MSYLFLMAAAAAPKGPKAGIFINNNNVVASFVVFVVFGFLSFYLVSRARSGAKMPTIRKIAGLEAIDEAIGRATEMGRPVHISNRTGGINDAQTFAFWGYLGYVAKTCARYDTKLINTVGSYLVQSVNQEIIRSAYLEVGRPDAYNPDDIRYYTNSQWAFTIAVMGMMERERPAANLWIGNWLAESMLLAEVGSQTESIQIAATYNILQIPFFITTCDFTLIGEELYAASAYLSKEPRLTGTIVAEDAFKLLLGALIVVGTVVATVSPKAKWLTNLVNQ